MVRIAFFIAVNLAIALLLAADLHGECVNGRCYSTSRPRSARPALPTETNVGAIRTANGSFRPLKRLVGR